MTCKACKKQNTGKTVDRFKLCSSNHEESNSKFITWERGTMRYDVLASDGVIAVIIGLFGTKYLRMDQVKFVKDSLRKF